MTRALVWVILLAGIAACLPPRGSGPGAPPKATDDTVDPGLLDEFQREVAANSAKAPSHASANVLHDATPTPESAAVSFPFLEVTTSDVQTDGRIAKIRGRVSNPYDEKVDGIRYLVLIGAPEGGDSHAELDRIASDSAASIEPHGSVSMRLDVSSMYFGGLARVPFFVVAAAKKIGGRDIPPPDGFRGSEK